jgi:hypothetical protein
MTIADPVALVQLVRVLASQLAFAKDREEEARLMRQIARHATRYDVIVSQGETRDG